MHLIVPSTADSVPVVRHALRGMLEAGQIEPAAVSDVLLAVTEACSNVVVHAYVGRDGDVPEMEVEAEWDADHLTVLVRDRGRGFAPRVDSPGLGLGLPVIAALTRRLELRETDGGGTEVSMSFAAVSVAASSG
jgi:anti-sigma regulatory factor (Ser/Thr protein kinase)